MTNRYLVKDHKKEWVAFNNMKARARPTSESATRRFGGGRWDGIEVEPDFLAHGGFQAFFEEVGKAPSSRHLLDRIDNSRGYVRENLKWSTPLESTVNRTNSNMITAFGKTQASALWAREYSIDPKVLRARVFRYGWEPERALTQPVKHQGV